MIRQPEREQLKRLTVKTLDQVFIMRTKEGLGARNVAPWRLPRPDFHRLAVDSFRTHQRGVGRLGNVFNRRREEVRIRSIGKVLQPPRGIYHILYMSG